MKDNRQYCTVVKALRERGRQWHTIDAKVVYYESPNPRGELSAKHTVPTFTSLLLTLSRPRFLFPKRGRAYHGKRTVTEHGEQSKVESYACLSVWYYYSIMSRRFVRS